MTLLRLTATLLSGACIVGAATINVAVVSGSPTSSASAFGDAVVTCTDTEIAFATVSCGSGVHAATASATATPSLVSVTGGVNYMPLALDSERATATFKETALITGDPGSGVLQLDYDTYGGGDGPSLSVIVNGEIFTSLNPYTETIYCPFTYNTQFDLSWSVSEVGTNEGNSNGSASSHFGLRNAEVVDANHVPLASADILFQTPVNASPESATWFTAVAGIILLVAVRVVTRKYCRIA
jgi:hypothetical protein